MDIFKDLLENTKGYPDDQREDLRRLADTLKGMSALSNADLRALTQNVLDHLPEIRAERATHAPEEERERLLKSAQKLASPGADEQFRRRAALVEMAFLLKAKLRDAAMATPETDPTRLKKFQRSLAVRTARVPKEVDESHSGREMIARYDFVQTLRQSNGNVDQALDTFYKQTFEDMERGHKHDMRLDRPFKQEGGQTMHDTVEADAPDDPYLPDMDDATQRVGPREETLGDSLNRDADDQVFADYQEAQADRMRKNAQMVNAMPILAAEHLPPKEYAAYRVLIDNEHLLDWKIDEKGKLHMQAKTLDALDDGNTVGKILQRDLNYQNIRGANLLIENTLEKMTTIMREHDVTKEAVLSDIAKERMGKSTAQIVADPAVQARAPKGKGFGR